MLKSRCSVEQKEKIWYNGEHIDMGKMILSLKNVYMILMTEDFPIYSESVIGRAERKGQTAITLQRLKRYREALDIYTAILGQLRNNGSDHQIHLYSNNISVVYLELDRPAEALSHLETALKPARQFGGIALGEVQRNRARAFGMLGNKAEELTCLEEAVPLPEKAYGAQHPRAQAARQRLEELEERKSSQ